MGRWAGMSASRRAAHAEGPTPTGDSAVLGHRLSDGCEDLDWDIRPLNKLSLDVDVGVGGELTEHVGGCLRISSHPPGDILVGVFGELAEHIGGCLRISSHPSTDPLVGVRSQVVEHVDWCRRVAGDPLAVHDRLSRDGARTMLREVVGGSGGG